MKQVCLTDYITFIIFTFAIEKIQCDCNDMTDIVHKNIGLAESHVWRGKTQTVEHCMQMCVRRTVCNSVNYDMLTTQCELNTGTFNNATRNKTGKYLVYAEFSSFPLEFDPICHSRPCGTDEVCIPFNGGPDCSYTCMSAGRKVCPMPENGVSGGRYVGDINEFSCGIGYVGDDSATCLPNGKWSKKINSKCELINGHECEDDVLCSFINGECSSEKECRCRQFDTYDTNTHRCVLDCGEPPDVDFADMSGNSEVRTYACQAGYRATSGSVATITCTDSGWTPSNMFSCYGICDPPPDIGGATLSGTNDDFVRTYTCGVDLIPRPGTSNGTIVCTEDGSWEPEGFECYGIRLAPVTQTGPITFNYIGFLEVFLDGEWVNIDRDHWTWEATKVVCREINNNLIYGGTHHKEWFGMQNSGVAGQDTKKLEDLDCSGNEPSLINCTYTSENGNNNHDIVITCFDFDIMDGNYVRLEPIGGDDEELLVIQVDSTDGVVCESGWDNNKDGVVSCKTMNLDSSDTSKGKTTSSYTVIASGVDCTGTEAHLFYCMNKGWGYADDCDPDDHLKIKCG